MTVIDLPTLAAAALIGDDRYRSLMRAFPTGVTVVTTVDAEGEPQGMTCSSLTSVSAEGSTLLVGLTTSGTTCNAVRWNGAFAVNLLHAAGQDAARLFSRPGADRFSGVAWRRSPGTGLPWLTEHAFAAAECRVLDLVEVGDHTLAIGQVIGVHQIPGTPLLYADRGYAAWPGGVVPAHEPAPASAVPDPFIDSGGAA